MASDTDRVAGKNAYLLYNSIRIPIVKITPKVTRKLGDTTDSGDYSSDQDMIGTTQIPCTYTMEASIEGRFRRSSTPSGFLANAFNSLTQIPIVIGINFESGLIWGSGVCDLSDFQTDIPVDDIVNFTANIRSWGIFTPNS